MGETKLILTGPVLPPVPLDRSSETLSSSKLVNFQPDKISSASEDEKKQTAKDFESVLLSRLLDEMKRTIGDWGFDEDGAAEQIQGIFWLGLSSQLANDGGLGLWKDIYQFLTKPDQTNTPKSSIDASI